MKLLPDQRVNSHKNIYIISDSWVRCLFVLLNWCINTAVLSFTEGPFCYLIVLLRSSEQEIKALAKACRLRNTTAEVKYGYTLTDFAVRCPV